MIKLFFFTLILKGFFLKNIQFLIAFISISVPILVEIITNQHEKWFIVTCLSAAPYYYINSNWICQSFVWIITSRRFIDNIYRQKKFDDRATFFFTRCHTHHFDSNNGTGEHMSDLSAASLMSALLFFPLNICFAHS